MRPDHDSAKQLIFDGGPVFSDSNPLEKLQDFNSKDFIAFKFTNLEYLNYLQNSSTEEAAYSEAAVTGTAHRIKSSDCAILLS